MRIVAFYTDDGTPATGLSPTIRIRDLSDNSLVVTDAAMTEVGDGHYQYNFTTYNADEDYAIRCDGGITLSDSDRYTYAGNENYIEDIEGSNLSTQIIGVSADVADVNTNVLGVSAAVGDISSDTTNIITEIDSVNTNVLGVSADVGDLQTDITNIQSDITTINTNVLGVSGDIGDLQTDVTNIQSDLTTVSNDLKRLLGLTHENIFIDNPVYDGNNNMTSARVRIYSDAVSVGTASNVIGTYTITAPGDGPGKFTTWKQVKN